MIVESQIKDYVKFPEPSPDDEGLICGGGELSPEILISAYRQGVFPWFNSDEPIMWWSPIDRCVVEPGGVGISKNMKRLIRQKKYTVTMDCHFSDVIKNCSSIKRKKEEGTWISDQIIESYTTLHKLGIAHSVEVLNDKNELVGGLYGISLGKIFFGESMFSKESNTSKIAFVHLSEFLKKIEFELIDCQITNPHLISLGAYEISRKKFLKKNALLIQHKTSIGNWQKGFKTFIEKFSV